MKTSLPNIVKNAGKKKMSEKFVIVIHTINDIENKASFDYSNPSLEGAILIAKTHLIRSGTISVTISKEEDE